MKLHDLVKEIQDELVNGVLDFIIYKEGRQWKYEDFDETDKEDVEKYEVIKTTVDPRAIIVNGNESYAYSSLKYLEMQTRKIYKAERGN